MARIFYLPSYTPMHCSLCWEFSISMLNNKRTQCYPHHRLLYAIKNKALLSSLVTKIIYNSISLLKNSDVETWNICLIERKKKQVLLRDTVWVFSQPLAWLLINCGTLDHHLREIITIKHPCSTCFPNFWLKVKVI